jgi:hypothetical protein
MKKIFFALCTLCVIIFSACKSDNQKAAVYLPSVSGSAFEVLLVIDDSIYQTPAGEAIFYTLNAPTPILPQPEPMFKMSKIDTKHFDNLLKATRNIVFVEVNPNKYTQAKINLSRNRWANTQAIANVVAPDTESLKTVIESSGNTINDYFIQAERERMVDFYRNNINAEALRRVYSQFGCKIALPTSLNKFTQKDNFLWITNGSAQIRQDIVIYSTPYTSTDQLTHEAIMARRDSVMQINMPGGFEGSYMGTEYRYLPPVTNFVTHNNAWCAETRGLWKMLNGEHMGGPFVSLTRVDEMNMRIITIEGFVFAPGKDKRNPIRQIDAMLYSLLLPHEVNEVVITAKTAQ